MLSRIFVTWSSITLITKPIEGGQKCVRWDYTIIKAKIVYYECHKSTLRNSKQQLNQNYLGIWELFDSKNQIRVLFRFT